MNSDSNYDDEIDQKKLEAEVDALMEQSRTKGKNPYDLDIDFKELDEVFEDVENETSKVTIEKKEIRKLFNEYEKQIDKEIDEELTKEYKPSFSENDYKRVDHILKTDDIIRQALTQGDITKEELLMMVDYYEIYSVMNRAKKDIVVKFRDLDELLSKDLFGNDNENPISPLEQLTSEIEKKISISESILDTRVDYNQYVHQQGEYLASQKDAYEDLDSPKKSNELRKSMNVKSSNSPAKTDTLNNSRLSEGNNNVLMTSQIRKLKPITNRTGINCVIKPKIELFNDQNQVTNLLKVRNDRKEIIKANYMKHSHRAELFKFPRKKMTQEENQKLKDHFIQLLEEPKGYVEKARINIDKKNMIKKRIEDAQNYYKVKK